MQMRQLWNKAAGMSNKLFDKSIYKRLMIDYSNKICSAQSLSQAKFANGVILFLLLS